LYVLFIQNNPGNFSNNCPAVNLGQQCSLADGSIKGLNADPLYEDVVNYILDTNSALNTVEKDSFWATS